MNTQIKLPIEEFIHGPYKDFARYVLDHRAIPNVIDGLKGSQRKALWSATQSARSKFIKIAALSGITIARANYHHGDSSMNDCISLMGSDWANNEPLLDGDGNFGSRIVTEPSAPRYIFVKLSQAFDKYFKDNDILPINHDHENPEPEFYLPIIPWVLVNGIKGIAVGHSCEIQSYNPKDLSKAVIEYIKTGSIKTKLKPWVRGFSGDIIFNTEQDKYIAYGKYTQKGRLLTITELPYGIDRETYIKHLDRLDIRPDSPFISYIDKSKDRFHFEIKLKNGVKLSHDAIIKKFKLQKSLNQNLTTIDENKKLKIFQNPEDIVKHFVDYRITKYVARYQYYIKRDQLELDKLQYKLLFIKSVVNGDITLQNKSKDNIIQDIKQLNIPDEHISMCLAVRIHTLCSDEIKKLQNIISDLKNDINVWSTIDHKAKWISELKDL